MSRLATAERRSTARVAVLALALLLAPTLSAEPRERWPDADSSGDERGRAGVGAAPEFLADLLPGQCNGSRFGAIAGATLGGVLGSRMGDGDNSALATTAGTLIGMFIGSSIGRSIDEGDANCGSQPEPPPREEGVISATQGDAV